MYIIIISTLQVRKLRLKATEHLGVPKGEKVSMQ